MKQREMERADDECVAGGKRHLVAHHADHRELARLREICSVLISDAPDQEEVLLDKPKRLR